MIVSKTRLAIITQRRTNALRLRATGTPLQAIADQLGYSGVADVSKDITRALAQRNEDMKAAAAHYVNLELERLEAMEQTAWKVLQRAHEVVSHGRIIYDETTGQPLVDDAPVLAAIDRLIKIQDRRARYLGLDAPTRAEIHNVDAYDREIEQLLARLAAGGQSPTALAPAAADTPAGDTG